MRSRRTRLVLLAAALVAAAVAAAWLVAPAPSDDLPLSPGSAAADGTMAAVELLEELGAEVVVDGSLPDEAGAALVLVDNVEDPVRDEWRAFADQGGTLVVADPLSELSPPLVGETAFGFFDTTIGRDCDLAALEGSERIDPGGARTFDVPAGGAGCFPRGEGHWLVAVEQGDGVVVSVGGAGFLINDRIGAADNAVLLAALLAADPGATVAVVPPDFAGPSTGVGLVELVPAAAWIFMAQLMAAFCFVILWRMRRLGAPVVEHQPVALPGSELVLSLGHLYEHGGSAAHAGRLLREDARRSLAARLGLDPGADAEQVADAAVAAGADKSLAHAVLTSRAPDNDDDLVALGAKVERLRDAVGRPAVPKNEGAVRV